VTSPARGRVLRCSCLAHVRRREFHSEQREGLEAASAPVFVSESPNEEAASSADSERRCCRRLHHGRRCLPATRDDSGLFAYDAYEHPHRRRASPLRRVRGPAFYPEAASHHGLGDRVSPGWHARRVRGRGFHGARVGGAARWAGLLWGRPRAGAGRGLASWWRVRRDAARVGATPEACTPRVAPRELHPESCTAGSTCRAAWTYLPSNLERARRGQAWKRRPKTTEAKMQGSPVCTLKECSVPLGHSRSSPGRCCTPWLSS
jgi:hypothetical protein